MSTTPHSTRSISPAPPQEPHSTTFHPIKTPPRWSTEGFIRPTMPVYATRDSYIASGPAGVWPSPAGPNSSFITVTATSPGPPIGKNSPNKTDYVSYSPASHLLSDLEARYSRPSSPSPSVQPHTPARLRRSSVSSSTGTQSINKTLSRASSRHRLSPVTKDIHKRTSRDDLSDVISLDDPRSIMTEEALQVGQPSLANMMDALESHTSPPSSPGLPVIKTEPIRLAPPIWTMTRPDRLTPPTSGSQSPRTTDTDHPMTPSFGRSHDPFIVPTSYASRGRLDPSRVSFPTSRAMSEGEAAEEEDDDQAESGISLNEAEVRGIETALIMSPKARVEKVDGLGVKEKRAIGGNENVKQDQPTQTKKDDTTAVLGEESTVSVTSTYAKLERSKSQMTRNDQSSLPRLLKPRLKINFAWDDMTIPSFITIVSTSSKGEEQQVKQAEPPKSTSESQPKPLASTTGVISPRARTSSLNWATGLAIDTASGMAKYGLSYVPGPIRRRALLDRQWASETG